MKPTTRPCPCHSGLRHAECCAPMHQGRCEAAHPEALMRSRYSAFALGLGHYLLATLSEDHDDRRLVDAEREALVHELSRAKDRQRFLGLRIAEAWAREGRGEVAFEARIFERGVDRSFAERSEFRLEPGDGLGGGGWRYVKGEVVPPSAAPVAG